MAVVFVQRHSVTGDDAEKDEFRDAGGIRTGQQYQDPIEILRSGGCAGIGIGYEKGGHHEDAANGRRTDVAKALPYIAQRLCRIDNQDQSTG